MMTSISVSGSFGSYVSESVAVPLSDASVSIYTRDIRSDTEVDLSGPPLFASPIQTRLASRQAEDAVLSSQVVMGHFPIGFLGLAYACLRPDVAVFDYTA